MNKAQLIGHVGKDPELRSMQGGGKVATFSLATSEAWKDKKTGERKEKTEWHRIGGTIELLDRKPAEPSATDDAPPDNTYAGELEDDIAF